METVENFYNPFIKTVLKDGKQTDLLFGLVKIAQKTVDNSFPVDLVYFWVNGNDKNWQENKQFWQNNLNQADEQGIIDGRFSENDELKYSLRSVEKFMPWINRIFIVTDEQVPVWLDVSNPKIKLVFHKSFIPQENLPLFNSEALETYLPNIPDLSEHFIYANDDTYVAKPVGKFFFFDFLQNPIIRLKYQVSKRQAKKSMYNRTILHTQNLMKLKFGKTYPFAPHHNMDSYRRSDFLECKTIFKKEFETAGKHKFRTENDIHRVMVSYYALYKNQARLKLYSRVDRYLSPLKRFWNSLSGKYCADSVVLGANGKDLEKRLKKYNPTLFCINDGEGVSDTDRQNVRNFLEKMFPQKSSFEL